MSAPRYVRPLDAEVAQWAAGLDEEAREFFEERAAVREYDGGMSRRQAERAARQDTQHWLRSRQGTK